MLWKIVWVEYLPSKNEVQHFLDAFPGSEYTGLDERTNLHEVQVEEQFEAASLEDAKHIVLDNYQEVHEFGCKGENGEYFGTEDL